MQLFSEWDKPVACKRSNKDSCHDLGLRGSLLWWRALWRPNMLLCKCLLQENYDDVLKNQLKCNIIAKIHDCTVHDANSRHKCFSLLRTSSWWLWSVVMKHRHSTISCYQSLGSEVGLFVTKYRVYLCQNLQIVHCCFHVWASRRLKLQL